MDWSTVIWVAFWTTLIVFSTHRIYIMGYRAGARRIIREWKRTMEELEDYYDEEE